MCRILQQFRIDASCEVVTVEEVVTLKQDVCQFPSSTYSSDVLWALHR